MRNLLPSQQPLLGFSSASQALPRSQKAGLAVAAGNSSVSEAPVQTQPQEESGESRSRQGSSRVDGLSERKSVRSFP